MTATTKLRMPGTPPKWVNTVVRGALHTPLLRSLLGGMFAVMTVTGARTGRRYSTPVEYLRHGDDWVVLSQRMRTWWRNLSTRPDVELLIRGTSVPGHAVLADGEHARTVLTDCLEQNPRVAKFYGIELDRASAVDPAAVDELLDRVVVIVITPDIER
jgi:deazaflavin-dependent oxidoreductase (nitroreductase family)